MRRLGNLFLVIVIALGLPAVLPALALADQATSCASNDNTKVRVWENKINDTSDGNDSTWFCGSDNDLSNDSHTPAGDCNRPWPPSGNWSDCISSYTLTVADGKHFCLYKDTSYDTLIVDKIGPITSVRYNVPVAFDDTASSLRFLDVGTSCTD